MTQKSISLYKVESLKVGILSKQDVQMLAKIHVLFVIFWKLRRSFRSTN